MIDVLEGWLVAVRYPVKVFKVCPHVNEPCETLSVDMEDVLRRASCCEERKGSFRAQFSETSHIRLTLERLKTTVAVIPLQSCIIDQCVNQGRNTTNSERRQNDTRLRGKRGKDI